MNSRNACLVLVLVGLIVALQAPVARGQSAFGQLQSAAGGYRPNIPDVPDPVCAECNRKHPNHASNCSYARGGGGGGGDSDNRPAADLSRAPIVVAPIGMVGGVFVGGAWYFCEMGGKYPNVNFLKSYHKYVSLDTKDPQFDNAWNFGTHIGGAPWLALFLPTWPLRQGVVGLVRLATAPAKPKPPDPRIGIYEAIARNYEQLHKSADAQLEKAAADIKAAEWRRNLFLDDFISQHPDLVELQKQKGVEAARARAQKKLDTMSKVRAAQAKLIDTLSANIRERDALCRAAIEKASAASFLGDLYLYRQEKVIDERLADQSLPPEITESLKREKMKYKVLSTAKTVYDVGSNLKEIKDSYTKAKAEGKPFDEWWKAQETEEQLLRLNLKLLPMLSKVPEVGLVASAAETVMDGAYAIATSVAYHDQLEADRALLAKLRTAGVFRDVIADDWDRLNIKLEAARERQQLLRDRHDQYENMQKENEKYASRLRRS